MKKVLFGILALMLASFGGVAYATEVSVQPTASVHIFDDFKTAPGIGVRAIASDVPTFFGLDIPKEVEFGAGVEYVGTEVNNIDADVTILSSEVGYKYNIDEKLSVKPLVGLDAYLISEDKGNTIDNTIGTHVGVEFGYQVKKDLAVNGGLNYSFAGTDVNGVENQLDGLSVTGGLTYKF